MFHLKQYHLEDIKVSGKTILFHPLWCLTLEAQRKKIAEKRVQWTSMHATWALNVKMRHENGYERLLKIHHIQNALTLMLNVLLSGRKNFSGWKCLRNYAKIMHAKPSTSYEKHSFSREWWAEIPVECLMRVKMHLRMIHYAGASRKLSFRIDLTFDEWKALRDWRWWSAFLWSVLRFMVMGLSLMCYLR